MGKKNDVALEWLLSAFAAAIVAGTIGYIAHFDLGMRRQDIRGDALVGVAIVAALLGAGTLLSQGRRKP
jgi:hypothetical protein